MILLDTHLAFCADRSVQPKLNEKYGDPTKWLSQKGLSSVKTFSLTFDFFVNWSNVQVSRDIWIKKILMVGVRYEEVIESYKDIFSVDVGKNYINQMYQFASKHDLQCTFIIFLDDQDWGNPNSNLLLGNLESATSEDFNINFETILINDFMGKIRELSGGKVSIGQKGLLYGTTNLECYLSHTDSAYPGDVDFLLLDDSFMPIAVLEFKKHTLDSPISDQKLSNYYPNPDRRKYDRLSIFRDYLRTTIPILDIYYPTEPTILEGRLELLIGSTGNLKTNIASNFFLSDALGDSTFLINKVLKAIDFHNNFNK